MPSRVVLACKVQKCQDVKTPMTIEELFKRLSSSKETENQLGLADFEQLSIESKRELIQYTGKALGDLHWGDQANQCLDRLIQFAETNDFMIGLFLDTLPKINPMHAQSMAYSLSTLGIRAIPTLCKTLTDPRSDARQWSAHILGGMHSSGKEAVQSLLSRTKDPEDSVRATVAEA